MTLERASTALDGFVELRPRVHRDRRGTFVKVFHEDTFRALGLPTRWAETYGSVSGERVVRGLHFQTPPHEHHKLVWCLGGAVLDAALDLRRGSPTYGRHATVPLSADAGNAVLLAPGLAHGFCVVRAPAILVYQVTTAYAPDHDAGVRWDSAGIDWPVTDPLVSERDRSFPALEDFGSPFRAGGTSEPHSGG